MKKTTKNNKLTITVGIMLGIFDAFVANMSYGFALWLRFDFSFDSIPDEYINCWLYMIPIFGILTVITFAAFRLYSSIWVYVSYTEVIRASLACLILGILQIVLTIFFITRMPVAYYFVGWLLMFILLTGIRASYRMLRLVVRGLSRDEKSCERVIIAGAGEAGRMLIRDINSRAPRQSSVICLVDDNPDKQNRFLDGIPIKGSIGDVPQLVKELRIDRVIIAIPSADEKKRREIIQKVKEADCKIGIMPKISSIINRQVTMSMIRNVSLEDLLGRESINIDNGQISRIINNRTVLITGGGGSIGSELSRQIASFGPKKLIIFDIYENNAYEIQQELRRNYPGINLDTVIGSVRDEKAISRIMKISRPDLVVHAAAHKHVPLMENVPFEAIKNNVFGTYNCAKAAAEFGVKRFLLISTDKAVNPTNIMGASKRLCERVVEYMNETYDTEYFAVRFGNVLGSNGSVVPLFQRQIAEGGPVTVTHPEITRFFMTIPEAVSLVLQASVYSKGGEIFVLDMGEPVKIDNLARNLITLAGLVPDIDINIKYTGLRPGEKLYEEILMDEEGLKKTENNLIFIGKQMEIPRNFMARLEKIREAAENNSDNIIEIVKEAVPTYMPGRDN